MKTTYLYIALTLALSFTLVNPAEAQSNNAELNVSAGVEYSDNLSRSSGSVTDGEQEETAYIGGLDFKIDSRSSTYRLDAVGEIERRQYENGLFDDETVGRLVGNLDWILAEERFFWNLSANHGQQIVNPFQPATPQNREDVTIVSTGPTLNLPIDERTFLIANVSQSEARYEERPLDNTRLQGSLSLERQIAPTRTMSLNVGGSQIDYDDDQLLPEIDQLNASVGFAVETARNEWSVDLGWNYFERGGQDGDGLLLDLAFRHAVTESSSLRLGAGSKYSTNGDIFRLNQQLESSTPDNRLFNTDALDIQGFGDVFRNDYISVGYIQSFGRTDINLSGSWQAEEYQTTTGLDRDAVVARVSLRRELSKTMRISAFASLSRRDYESRDRVDDDSTFGLSFKMKLGRNFSLTLGARQFRRDSDSAEFDYDETRADLTLSYAVL